MSHTTARTLQWIVIILIVSLIGGGVYHYFSARAAKINTTPTTFNTSGLVGYWTFDGAETVWTSTTAGTTLDKSGQNNTGTLTSMNQATSPAIGKHGQALNFDGSTSYVEIPDNPAYTLGTAFTYSAWIKTSDTVGEIFSNFEVASPFVGTLFGVGFGGTNGKLSVWISTSSGSTVQDTGSVVNDNTWRFVTASYDGTNVRFYRDGALSSTIAATNSVGNSSNVLRIGRDNNSPGERYYNGSLDDVRIYNRALSASEVTQLYNAGR